MSMNGLKYRNRNMCFHFLLDVRRHLILLTDALIFRCIKDTSKYMEKSPVTREDIKMAIFSTKIENKIYLYELSSKLTCKFLQSLLLIKLFLVDIFFFLLLFPRIRVRVRLLLPRLINAVLLLKVVFLPELLSDRLPLLLHLPVLLPPLSVQGSLCCSPCHRQKYKMLNMTFKIFSYFCFSSSFLS